MLNFALRTPHPAPKLQRAVTIGVFDGVHMGHRELIGRLISEAHNRSLTATVITFANHPQSVLSPPSPPLLTTVEERLELLAELGVDETVVLPFTIELSRLTAEQFCREILVGKLACKLLVVGDDFALGYRREGTVAKLKELGKQLGFEVIVVSSVTSEGIRVSSSEIRQLLLQGDVERANELLGKPYRIIGNVVKGAGRGQKLGFPTINLKVEPEKLLPRFGVYAGKVSVAQSDKTNFALPTPHPAQHSFDAAAYIGQRPTFGENEPDVEAYLLDFNGVVPEGTKVTLELVAFIRPDQKFDSADALIEQMNRDVQAVREKLKARA
jgi:riboflavin kinase/FMN adenylyltransferase